MDKRTKLQAFAPLISAGADWGTRRALVAVYKRRNGRRPPTRDTIDIPFRKVLAWTVISALTAALVDLAIQQSVARAVAAAAEDTA